MDNNLTKNSCINDTVNIENNKVINFLEEKNIDEQLKIVTSLSTTFVQSNVVDNEMNDIYECLDNLDQENKKKRNKMYLGIGIGIGAGISALTIGVLTWIGYKVINKN